MFSSKTISRTLTSAAVLLFPITGFALFSSSAQLLDALENDMRPREYKMELHGYSDTTYFSLWANGSQQGLTSSDARGAGMMTIDVVDDSDDVNVRIKLETRYTNGMLYIKLNELSGSAEGNALDDVMIMGIQEQWVSIPLDFATLGNYNQSFGIAGLEMKGHKQLTEAQTKRVRRELMNALFSINHTIRGNTEQYTLALQPDFLIELLRVMVGVEAELRDEDRLAAMANVYTDEELRETQAELYEALNVSITVDTTNDAITEWKTLGAMDMTEESTGFSVRGHSKFIDTPVLVDVPTSTVSLEDAIFQYLFLLDFNNDDSFLLP